MNLTTNYLGLELSNPFMPGASPLVDDLGEVRRMEDAGASAIVLHSLFEEQIEQEAMFEERHMDVHEHSFVEAATYRPNPSEFVLEPNQYLDHLHRIKESVSVPVIGSLNGTLKGGWIRYANLIQQAGADALEINVYFLPAANGDPDYDVESRTLDIVKAVRNEISIPTSVKLSPFFSSLPRFATELDTLGIDGIVLFNRFYQPDIDIEALEVVPHLELSTSSELLLRIRWLAALYGQINASLAVTGGVHTREDAIKSIMAGAAAVQVVSALLRNGTEYLRTLIEGTRDWLEENEYESLRQMQGSMSLKHCPNPEALERVNYLRTLQVWRS